MKAQDRSISWLSSRRLRILAPALAVLAASLPARGSLIWFDAAAARSSSGSFAELADAYARFVGRPEQTITFDGLGEGELLADQYEYSYGVRFANTRGGRYGPYSGVRWEGGAIVEDLTGYDGSYRPDGDPVYVKFDNHLLSAPFTMIFDAPVALAGAFVAMGVQGTVHTLTVRAYDAGGVLLGTTTTPAWRWETRDYRQNYESFFAVRSDAANIARIEILNNSQTDFANALAIDDISFSRAIPEPVALLPALGALAFLAATRRQVSA